MERLISKKEIQDVFTDTNTTTTREYNFILKYYQKLGSILINQYTSYKRLLCIMEPGMGKTLFSLNIAYNLSKVYFDHWLIDGNINGYVIVLGTTNDIFQDELLSWLNFGFLSKDELIQLNTLRQKASNFNGSNDSQEEYLSYRNHIKRRLKNKHYRGFYQFFGYKKFVNDLFILPKNFDMLTYTTDQIIELIDKGTIMLNKNITNLFEDKNSIIIADEFHDTYNSVEKNTYGYAIKTILHYYPETRLVALTATEINNNSTELLDILSFLEYKDSVPSGLFEQVNGAQVLTHKKDVLDKLFDFLTGKIFVCRNTNITDYPTTIQHGEYINVTIGGKKYQEDILKFILCETPENNEIKKQLKLSEDELRVESILFDIIIPKVVVDQDKLSTIGHFTTIKSAYIYYKNIEQNELINDFIRIVQHEDTYILEGKFLHKDNLKIYSPKYHTMLVTMLDNIRYKRGKTYIYHKYINEGINIISSILLENGFLREGMMSNNETICSLCSMRKVDHDKLTHKFQPCIWIEYTGESNKNDRFIILAKWNSIDNKQGTNYMMLLSTITQSLTLLSTRCCFIMFKPKSVPNINQIFGRIRRNRSHEQLDAIDRNVNYYIYANKTGGEIEKYAKKIVTFMDIQRTKQIVYRSAFNLYLDYSQIEHSENIFDVDISDVYTYIDKKKSTFDLTIDKTTFKAFYTYNEIIRCFQFIKQLFHNYNYLHEDNIYKEFTDEFDTFSFEESNYEIALYLLCYNNKSRLFLHNAHIINSLLDTNITKRDGITYKLCYYEPYYVTLPYINEDVVVDHIFLYMTHMYNAVVEDMGLSHYIKSDITAYLAEKTNISYYDIKKDIFTKYKNFDIDIISEIVVNYDEPILINLIKDCVIYIFRILINPRTILSEFHEKYIKLIFYFDSLNIIIYANSLIDTPLYDNYKDFIKDGDFDTIEFDANKAQMTISKIQTLIKSTYSKSSYSLDKYYTKFTAYLNTKSTEFINATPIAPKTVLIRTMLTYYLWVTISIRIYICSNI